MRGVRTRNKTSHRAGLTLLEVLVSLAILGGALTAIGRLTSNGATAALRCEQQTDAALRCRSQLDLLLAGTAPIRDIAWQAFADDPQWRWSATLSPASERQLATLTVAVERIGSKPTRFQLTQFIRQSRLKARLR